MTVRTYVTDELCPFCGCNILEGLCKHVYEEGGRDFEYECPSCEHIVEIEVEPVPAFSISKPEAPQHRLAADGGIGCAICGGPKWNHMVRGHDYIPPATAKA